MPETPSQRRSKGYMAFDPNTKPLDVCPYTNIHYRDDWMDGWNDALDQHRYEEMNKARSTFDLLKEEVESKNNSNAYFDRLTYAQQQWILGLCTLMDKHVRGVL